jgi:hypothetical protein
LNQFLRYVCALEGIALENGFRVVFDLATSPDHWFREMGSMIVLPLAGIVAMFLPERLRNSRFYRGPKGAAAKIFGFVFFLVTGAILGFTTFDHFHQKAAYEAMQHSGKLAFVEGCLRSFHPMPLSGHDTERIDVAGRKFVYSDFDVSSPAFNNTEAYGGPIHSDSAVRIWCIGNNIIKLEVRDHACRLSS